MTSPTPEKTYDTTAIASRVMYELLGRRLVWPPMRVTDAYPLVRELVLTGRPVSSVETVVTSNGDTVDGWQLYSGFRIRLPIDYMKLYRYCTDNEVLVTYVYGSVPPAQVSYAIDVLASQLDLAIAGSSECKLPKRITSISRQGVSMTILDPQNYLDKGRTGVPEVDAVIMTFNPSGARARSRIFTGTNPPARRLSTEALPGFPDTTDIIDIDGGSPT